MLDNSKLQKLDSDILGEQTLINSITTNSNNSSLDPLTNYSAFEETRTAKGLPGFFEHPDLSPQEKFLIPLVKSTEIELRKLFPNVTIMVGNSKVDRSFFSDKTNFSQTYLNSFLIALQRGNAVNSIDIGSTGTTIPRSPVIFFNLTNLAITINALNPNDPLTVVKAISVNEAVDSNESFVDLQAAQPLIQTITNWLAGGIRQITSDEFLAIYQQSLGQYPDSKGYLTNPAQVVQFLDKAIKTIFGIDVGLVANGSVIIPTKFIKGFGNFSGQNYRGTDGQDNVIINGNTPDANSLRQSDELIVASTALSFNGNVAKGLDTVYFFPNSKDQTISLNGGQGNDILKIIAPNGTGLYTINMRNCEQINIIGGSGTINRL